MKRLLDRVRLRLRSLLRSAEVDEALSHDTDETRTDLLESAVTRARPARRRRGGLRSWCTADRA